MLYNISDNISGSKLLLTVNRNMDENNEQRIAHKNIQRSADFRNRETHTQKNAQVRLPGYV